MALRRIGTDIAPVRAAETFLRKRKIKKKNGSREESREARGGWGTDPRENAAVGTSNAQGRVEFRRIDAEELKASGQIVSGDLAALYEEA